MSIRRKTPPRRGPGHLGRRETPVNALDVESVQIAHSEEGSPPRVRQRTQEEERHIPSPPQYEPERMMKLMEELIVENRALREEINKESQQAPPTTTYCA